MPLSSDLINQFVKSTKDDTKSKGETIAYGTIRIGSNGSQYVQLDGSETFTPVDSTVGVKEGDRVIVMLKNHTATVTGNLYNRSVVSGDVSDEIAKVEILIAETVAAQKASVDQILADNVKINETLDAHKASMDIIEAENATISEQFEATNADIDNLKVAKMDVEVADAKYATIDNLDATNATVNSLSVAYAEFNKTTTDALEATDAKIEELESEIISVESLEGKYANIDFSNIDMAAVQKFYAKAGVITDIVVENGVITGKLVGVTITGDLIEGNTVKAEKLVIKGEDGLYYKLNVDGMVTEAEQTDYNSLDGQVIRAKTITATKISVDDLVAFDATIGGFNLTEKSIYSGVKESVENTTQGMYMDSEGQFALGDASNFIKYYKDANGNYILELSSTDEIRQEMVEQSTSIIASCQQIILSALDSYVKTSDYGEFKETVESQLLILADQIALNFTATTEHITDVDSDLQEKFNTLTKFFSFSVDGLVIGQTDSPYKIIIDNDRYSMYVGAVEVLWIDVETREVHTPELTITDRFRMLGYQVETDLDGIVNWEYVDSNALAAPVVTINGDVISIAIETGSADAYDIYLYASAMDAKPQLFMSNVTSSTVNLYDNIILNDWNASRSMTYQVFAVAKANGYEDSPMSEGVFYIYVAPLLSVPILSVDADNLLLIYDPSDNRIFADSYDVYLYYSGVDTAPKKCMTVQSSGQFTRIDLVETIESSDYYKDLGGAYQIYAVAKADGAIDTAMSAGVDYIYTVRLNKPTIFVMSAPVEGIYIIPQYETLTWDLYVDGMVVFSNIPAYDIIEYSKLQLELTKRSIGEGTYSIRVVTKHSAYRDSYSSDPVEYSYTPYKLETPEFDAVGPTSTEYWQLWDTTSNTSIGVPVTYAIIAIDESGVRTVLKQGLSNYDSGSISPSGLGITVPGTYDIGCIAQVSAAYGSFADSDPRILPFKFTV